MHSDPQVLTALGATGDPRVTMSEVFGPTIQGEGPSTGRAAMFVRFGLCNLDCAWCDTPYTWDWKGRTGTAYDRATELSKMTVDEIVEQLAATAGPVRRCVITGGEPLVQRSAVEALVRRLVGLGWSVDIETNGTIRPTEALGEALAVVSPKLVSADVTTREPIDMVILSRWVEFGAHFKFVIGCDADLDAAVGLVDALDIDPGHVWIMPEGTTADAQVAALPAIFDAAAERGWNLSARLHVLAFNDKRGV